VLYSLNWIPFGGFVKMYGQDDLRPDGGAVDAPDSFTSKTPLQRGFVLVAGVLMNLLFALLVFIAIAVGHGRPGDEHYVYIDGVVRDTPAAAAGLRPGDRVLAAAGQPVEDSDQLVRLVEGYAGRDMPLVVERGGERIELTVRPREEKPRDQGRVGVRLVTRPEYVRVPLWQAPAEGIKNAVETFRLMVVGLVDLVSGRGNLREVAGPIGMGQITGEVVERSPLPLWVTLANLTGLLSLNLFLLNLLPVPALDGGRLVFVILELLRGGRKVAPEREGLVHFVGLMVLLMLMFVIAYFDVVRLVEGRSFIP
jgi:regulator of sigma E protease